jgi:hypothetical protein
MLELQRLVQPLDLSQFLELSRHRQIHDHTLVMICPSRANLRQRDTMKRWM